MKRIEFYEKRKIFGIISAAIVAIGLLCTFIFGVQLDIQFKGGSFLSYNYEGSIDLNAVEGVAEEVLKTDVSVTTTTDPTGATIFKISTADKVSVDENEAIVQLSILIGRKEFTTEEPFCVDMTIGAKFKWDDVYDEETLQELLSKNAPALLLGYARPIIANITDAGPIPAYHLPFYNFTDD